MCDAQCQTECVDVLCPVDLGNDLIVSGNVSDVIPGVSESVWCAAVERDACLQSVVLDNVSGNLRSGFNFHGNLLCKGDAICVPECYVERVIFLFHDAVLSGHCGVRKVIDVMSRSFYFSRMHERVAVHVRNCDVCQRVKCVHFSPSVFFAAFVFV